MRRNMGRRGNVGNVGGGGPLMTGHLQDIDLELELLKRKREMIEQQQQLLAMKQQFQSSRHSYDQMRYNEPTQHGSNRDFAQLYDSGAKQRSQFGRKRQSENQWQYDSVPKRTTPQKKKNPPQFNQYQIPSKSGSGNFRAQKPHYSQGPKFSPRSPPPLMEVKVPKQSIGQKIANQKAQLKGPQKNFNPSKVTKTKAPPAPNKLAALPVTERKSLVAAASASIANETACVLLPDSVPSQQVSGRLELALGAIMKRTRELIASQPQPDSLLRSYQLHQRVMKQIVRERIRTVMLGKVVGSLNDILAIYREEFPEETDADLLNIGLEAAGISAPDQYSNIKFIKSEDRGEFFRANMSTLIETILNEMFSKLEDIYSNAAASDAPSEEQTDFDKSKESDAEKDRETDPDKNEETKETESEENKEGDVEMKDGDVEKKEGDVEKKKGDVEKKENDVEKKENDVEKKQNDVEKKEDIIPQNNTVIDLQKNKEQNNKNKEFTKEYKDFLNSTIKVHNVKPILPKIIKRYIPYIVKLLNLDTTYQSTKAAITTKANEMAGNNLGAKVMEQGQGDTTTAATPQTPVEQRQIYNLPYYVKIMGHPTLPRRKVMQGFLSQFNPQSIKKHRTIHNLLFVGFKWKTDFDAMVGADGTVIGRSTLTVRICSNQGPRESNGDNNEAKDTSSANDASQGEVKNDDNNDSIISSDLECQITDLLSSIRKSDEEDASKKLNGDVPEVNDCDKPNPENNTNEAKMEEEGDVKNDEENAGDDENAGNDENDIEEDQGEDAEGVESENPEAENVEVANETENTEAEKMEVANETEKPAVTDDSNKDENLQESHEGEKTPTKTDEQSDDRVGELKANATGRSTPSRMSARLANVTPSSIRTRRASRLMSQN